MIDEDPVLIIKDLLVNNWDANDTSLADAPRIHTGWYNYGSSDPQVTITNPDEFTVGGGNTGISAGTGDGGAAQVRAGTVTVNAWAGTRDDMEGVGDGGSNLNPKDAAYSMAKEVHGIIQNNADGTLDDGGNRQLNSLGADEARRIVDSNDDGPAVYRYEVTVKYTYITRT